jgi:hypothetical protein
MEGSTDFTGGGRNPEDGGSNWDAGYRHVFCSRACGGMLAVALTRGAKALWNRDEVFEYYRSYFATEQRLGWSTFAYNGIPRFMVDMFLAYWPKDLSAPELVAAKVDGKVLWCRFDKSLDEAAVISPDDLTIKVNGTAVNGITLAPPPTPSPRATNEMKPPVAGWVPNGIFRQNVGLILPAAVKSGDGVSISYAGGAGVNKLRSAVDLVNVASFTDQPVRNLTQSIGGVNTAYPIVAFQAVRPDCFAVAKACPISPTNSPRFTLWIPHLKLAAAPPATVKLFGQGAGTPALEIQIQADRRIRVIPRDAGGSIITQLITNALALNTAYSLRLDFDATALSATTGWNVYLNGVSAKYMNVGWAGGSTKTVGWSRSGFYQLGGTAAPYFTGEFGGMWLHTSERVTDPAAVAKFTSMTNGSLDIGTLGDGITGTQPAIFVVGNAAQYSHTSGMNRGTGPKLYPKPGTDLVDVSVSALRLLTGWN